VPAEFLRTPLTQKMYSTGVEMKIKMLAGIGSALLAACSGTVMAQGSNVSELLKLQGPVVTAGMKTTVTDRSVQAVGYRYADADAKPDAWKAKWIAAPESKENPVMVQFRKTITLNNPKAARFWISADVFYRLYVNGKLVSRGPADMGRDYDREDRAPRWMYDGRDASTWLHSGANTIAVEVANRRFVGSRVSRRSGSLLLEASIKTQAGVVKLTTDSTWKCQPDLSWSREGEWDATREAAGWQMAGFDDASWGTAKEIDSVWTPLAASQLPPLMEGSFPFQTSVPSPSAPLTITRDQSVTYTHRTELAAYPGLVIDGVRGTTVRIVPGEQAGNRSRVITLHLRDGLQQFEYPHLDSYSVLNLEFEHVTRPIKLLNVHSIASSMPVEYRGSFACSNEEWNHLWNTSRWLTQICMQTHHLDSPNHQEPICDPGDYLIESHANYYAFGSPWLARQDLIKFGLLLKDLNYQNFHTSYSLLWLQMLMKYYDYTGDASVVKQLAPEVFGLLDTFKGWIGANGLISEAPNYMFMDWVRIEGFECHHPPAVIGQGYMTATYYNAIKDAARTAGIVGNQARVAEFEALRKQVKSAFNRELWSADRGIYRDGKPFQTHVKPGQWMPADKDVETFSPHVNTLAVLYDLAPAEKQSQIMATIQARENPLNCEPYFMYFVLEALAHCGRFDQDGPSILARWRILPDTDTYHEMWNEGDLSHAWGSAPLVQMSSTVLGVRPSSPGWGGVSVKPVLGSLSWARGIVPTPRGDIRVSFKQNGGKLSYEITLPAGLSGTLMLPGKGRAISLHPGHQAG
jgi:alpha-L-rhamnosidase